MCGIGGIVRIWNPEQRVQALQTPHGVSIPEPWIDIIDQSVRHRGPDGQGRFRDRVFRRDGCVVDVAIVHRRLSIIDHSGGHQPMVWVGELDSPALHAGRLLPASEREAFGARWPETLAEHRATQRRVAVVFNGCVYNHRELRAELKSLGYEFATDHSDTEVLVHGWRAWGLEVIHRLDGMFACVIWDSARGAAFSLRDSFGEKPLQVWEMVSQHGSIHAFASVPAGLAQLGTGGDGRRRPTGPLLASGTWLKDWIQYGWSPESAWESRAGGGGGGSNGFAQQIGGSESEGGGEARSVRSRLSIDICTGRADANAILSVDVVDGLLRQAVHSRLEADVPLGCFLSGGVDSALVTRYAAERRPDVTAYTVRMPVASFDESALAEATARVIGVRHRVLDGHAEPAADLQAIIQQSGLPFGDSSLLAMRWVSAAAKREVSVALSGDGGDDLFLGYQRQAVIPWLQRLARLGPIALDFMRAVGSAIGRSGRRHDRAMRLIEAARFGGYPELVAIFPSPLAWELGLCPKNTFGRHEANDLNMISARNHGDVAESARRFDRACYLPFDLLRKADMGSMSAALEVRAPFLEGNLARAAMNAPMSSLMPGGVRKGLLRQVARKYFPQEIVDRPKMGFAIPIGEWFRTDYGGMRSMLLDHLSSVEPFGSPALGINLNMAFIRQMLDEHLGTGPSGLIKRDHSQRLYMLLVLSIWAKWLSQLR